jgi:hypothetical protein
MAGAQAPAMGRFGARMLALCQMGSHHHLVLQMNQANLSRLMCRLNRDLHTVLPPPSWP